MSKQFNGAPGKKPPAPSVKRRPSDFGALVEMMPEQLNGRTQCSLSASRPCLRCPSGGCARSAQEFTLQGVLDPPVSGFIGALREFYRVERSARVFPG